MGTPSDGRRSRDDDPGMGGVLGLPDGERTLVTWLMRQQRLSLPEIAAHIDQPEHETQRMLDGLIERAYVSRHETDEGVRYSARPAARSRKTAMPPDVWQSLDGLSGGRRGRR